MDRVDLNGLSSDVNDLVDRATTGEPVELMRDGRVVARLRATEPPKKRVDVDRLKALAARLPKQHQSAGDFIREMRDEGY